MCNPCYTGYMWLQATPTPTRRSNRLAAKPRVDYYEAPVPSEAAIRLREERAAARAQAQMVKHALRVQVRCKAAIARHEVAMARRTERIIARLERDVDILASMPVAPPRLERHNAVTELPPRPNLGYTAATGCDLPPPPPLRRTCQLPGCNEWCSYCRGNDRIAAANRNWNPLAEPLPSFIPPPPIGATVVRVPVDMRLMTQAALRELIAAAQAALNA
jgi:hypothetical protein